MRPARFALTDYAERPRAAGFGRRRTIPERLPLAAGSTVLLLGNYRPTLTAARQLHAIGRRVVLGCEPGTSCAERSRFVDEVWRAPAFGAADDFAPALRAFLAGRPDIGLVMPMTEPALNAVAAMEEELRGRVLVAAPARRAVELFHDKFAWLRFASEAGVDCPAFALASDLDGLAAAIEAIGCPVVIRPAEAGKRIGKRKAVTVASLEGLRAELPSWPKGLAGLLAQKRFEGARYNIYFGALDGEIVREQHSKSLRTDRCDGSGQTIEGVTVERIAALSEPLAKVARAIRYTGVGCAQFLYDEASGASCFLEINPRFGASYAFIELAGMELTRLAVDLARGSAGAPLDWPAEGRAGIRFVWSYGDFAGLLFCLKHGEIGARAALRWLGQAVAAALRADVHVVWSWRDPAPAFHFYAGRLAALFGR